MAENQLAPDWLEKSLANVKRRLDWMRKHPGKVALRRAINREKTREILGSPYPPRPPSGGPYFKG